MDFRYGVDPVENPIVVRVHSFSSESWRAFPTIAFFLSPGGSDYSDATESAIYTWNSALNIRSSLSNEYLYHFREPEWGDYGNLSFAEDSGADHGIPFPADFTVLELGFIPMVGGVPAPITRENLPEKIYVKVNQNYAGGVAEAGMYVDGVFRSFGSVVMKEYWDSSLVIEVEDPFDLTPKLHIRFVGVDSDELYYGTVGVYETAVNDSDEVTTVYRAGFAFDQHSGTAGVEVAKFVTDMAFYGSDSDITPKAYLESSVTPLLGGLPAPVNPSSPPPSIKIITGRAYVGGVIQIGAYSGGEFVVMGQSDTLTSDWGVEQDVDLVAVTGELDGDGQLYFRLADYEYSTDYSDYPYVSVFIEFSEGGEDTAIYDPQYETDTYTFEGGGYSYASGVSMPSVDYSSYGGTPTLRAILYEGGDRKEMDVMNPPPSINAFFEDYYAGGTLQVGAFLASGEFFVMGERELPGREDDGYGNFVIPLIAVPPHDQSPPAFWTGYVRTTEYL